MRACTAISGLVIAGAVAAFAAGLGGVEPTPAAASPQSLYPDLYPLAATDFRFDTVTINGEQRTVLRFSTTSANGGDGPLDLWADPEIIVQNGSQKQKVYQRVLLADGTWETLASPAGTFIYHDGHNHTHFQGYAIYDLHRPNDRENVRAHGAKTTFCIMDTTRIDRKLPGAPKRAVYRTCGGEVQGMSVGWGDKYSYYLDGQWVDVTDLVQNNADGANDRDYVLTIEVDPVGGDGEIKETTENVHANVSQAALCIDFTNLTLQKGSCGSSGGGPGPDCSKNSNARVCRHTSSG